MKFILQVDGREMTFSEQELTAIVKEHLDSETKVEQKPTEGEWFKVNFQAINQKLFKEKRIDSRQESTRQLILKAFAKVKANPKKYGKKFSTMMPERTWDVKTVAEYKQLASELGDHMADWVEQALEWAQRIQNGESWEAICNDRDTANWYRLVVWKNGYARLIGGSCKLYDDCPVSDVDFSNYNPNNLLNYTVPLVVLYN